MSTYSSFDVSTLEVGDVIHFNYDNTCIEKEIIIAINQDSEHGITYTVVCDNTKNFTYRKKELESSIEKYVYLIKNPFLGLELI